MSALDQAMVSILLNATLPTATGGKPAAFTNMATTTAMLLRVNSTLSTAAASGTQLPNGGGYVTGGSALGQSTASSAGSAVTIPASTITLVNSSGSSWTVASSDVTDSAGTRSWFGPYNGQPLTIANLNSLSIAANAISISDT